MACGTSNQDQSGKLSSHRLLLEELYDIWRLGWHRHRLGWRSWPQGQHNFAQLCTTALAKKALAIESSTKFPA